MTFHTLYSKLKAVVAFLIVCVGGCLQFLPEGAGKLWLTFTLLPALTAIGVFLAKNEGQITVMQDEVAVIAKKADLRKPAAPQI